MIKYNYLLQHKLRNTQCTVRNSFILFVTSLIKDCHDTSAKRRRKAAAKNRLLSFNRLKAIWVSVFYFHDASPLYVISLTNMTVLHHTIAALFYLYLNETEWQQSSSVPMPTQHTPQYLVHGVSTGIKRKKTSHYDWLLVLLFMCPRCVCKFTSYTAGYLVSWLSRPKQVLPRGELERM